MTWFPIGLTNILSIPYKIEVTEINMQDLVIDLGMLTEFEGQAFHLKRQPTQPYFIDQNVIFDLVFEMSFDQIAIERSNIEILDVFGDIGGVWSILISIFSGFLLIINHNHFDSFMASKLYKIKKETVEGVKYKSYFERSTFFKPSQCGNLRDYIIDCLPKRIVCCRRSRRERGIIKARTAMDREIDIVEIIK